jgi:hypothetical protein
MFATGNEGSYGTVRLPDGSRRRVDEMETCGHYRRWREDFQPTESDSFCPCRVGRPGGDSCTAPG